jgi:hypothetical protein
MKNSATSGNILGDNALLPKVFPSDLGLSHSLLNRIFCAHPDIPRKQMHNFRAFSDISRIMDLSLGPAFACLEKPRKSLVQPLKYAFTKGFPQGIIRNKPM